MFTSNNPLLNEIVSVVESSTKAEQKRMLYLLKVEKARKLARGLDKIKPKIQKTDAEIAETVHRIRKGYGKK